MIAPGESKRVLIVDDEPNVTVVLAAGLEKLGQDYVIETANSGSEALEKVEQTPYALMITDYKMPDLNGLDLAMAVRRVSPSTQVILMTAYGTAGLRDKVGNLHLDGYVDKPFSVARIREIVKDAVGRVSHEITERPSEPELEESVTGQMEALQRNTNARCVLLLSADGFLIETSGATDSLDISSMAALVAANFMAAAELAKLLGNTSVFKSSHHEGPDYNIYAYALDMDLLLAVVYGAEAKPGAIWYYTKQVAGRLNELITDQPAQVESLDELSEVLDSELDKAFGLTPGEGLTEGWDEGGDEASTAEASPAGEIPAEAPPHETIDLNEETAVEGQELLDYDKAVEMGLIPAEWNEK
jgi:CheY-like chemotaxis protein/predicted regulator of Ras-like GTPase activity (Roadblock/LC7/MglB family)